jgi:ferric hydroxamate transport system permease protein
VEVLGSASSLLLLSAALAVLSAWHLTQGTSSVGLGDLVDLATGHGDSGVRDILLDSRVPRLAAAVLVGFALGLAGVLLQSISRNPLASPDTLAVTAGAFLAVTVVAALGLAVPLWASGGVAFVGGLLAAALVLGLAGGAGVSTTRVVLAGSAVALALQAFSSALLILFQQETSGLYAWGSGSLSQLGLRTFLQAAPVVLAATAAGLFIARRLDLLRMGDDTASVLGVPVRTTRAIGILTAVLLTAAAVTLAGPIGFVGLFAPAVVRLLSKVVPALHRHAVMLPAAGLAGALCVVLADDLIRWLLGAGDATAVPTGVTTTLVGATALIAIARRSRDSGPTREPPAASVRPRSQRRFVIVMIVGAAAAACTLVLGLLGGQTWLRTGDIGLWLEGGAAPLVQFALTERAPRVAAALVAGGALALSGSMVQATCRNPLAEPGILGITGGAGLGAVIVVTGGLAGTTGQTAAAAVGALLAFAIVYGVSWRHGLNADRLILVGIGVWAGTGAMSTFLLVRANPWDTPRIFTWLSGTTYGRGWDEVVPVAVCLAIAVPIALVARRELDLLAVDEDTPRLVGVSLEPVRLLVLTVAALLAAASVSAVGVVAFVGLVCPHAARALVGGRHARSIPVAVLLGAILLGLADTVGRTVIAPAQLPAGIVVAAVGAPYFVYLLARSRA